MEFLIGVFVGLFVCGILCYIFLKRKKPSGTFVMDFSDPMKDICKLELDEDLDTIYKKKQIILNVKTLDISQQ